VIPVLGLSVVAFQENSGSEVFPNAIAPALSSISTIGLDFSAIKAGAARDPNAVGRPATCWLSFTEKGTPSKADSAFPDFHRSSLDAASKESLDGSAT